MIRTILRLSGIDGEWCRRQWLCTGQVMLSRTSIRRMLLQDGNQRVKDLMNAGLQEPGSAVKKNVKKVSKPKAIQAGRQGTLRLQSLNKMCLNSITDILSTGEMARDLYGRGLELSQVSIHPNFECIRVYWVTIGDQEHDQRTEEILFRCAKAVRQELSNQRILTHCPPITFARDDRYHKLQEVERLLSIADYGEDFEPTNPTLHLKAGTPTLAMQLDGKIKSAIEDLEGEQAKASLDIFEEALRIAACDPSREENTSDDNLVLPSNLPAMRGDVLDVNTSKIYNMIQQGMKKARAEHRKESDTLPMSFCSDQGATDGLNTFGLNRNKDIKQWGTRYKEMQRKLARKQNRENAMLSYPQYLQSEDLEEYEAEIDWVEEEDCNEFE